MNKDFFDKVAVDGKVPVDELVNMVDNGVLQIRGSEDAVFSISEVANLFNKDIRTVARWIEEGKLKAKEGVSSKVVTAKELERFYDLMPMFKNQTCIYVQANTIEEVNDIINNMIQKIGVNRYRCNIFADVDCTDGFESLMRHLIRYRGTVYSNVPIIDKLIDAGVVLSATSTSVVLI